MEQELGKALVNAGLGGVIAALIIYLVYRLTSSIAVNIGMRLVAAFESQAEAITKQAVSMEGLTKSIKDFVSRDNLEHREILVLLRFMAQGHGFIHKDQSEVGE